MIKKLISLFSPRLNGSTCAKKRPVDDVSQLNAQLQSMVNDPRNALPENCDIHDTFVLCQLTHHHNGHLREKAVQCLGLRRDIAAIEELLASANDWVKEVRLAAKTALRGLMTHNNTAAFAVNLPAVRKLLICQRSDHTQFVAEIMHFLLTDENLPQLQHWLVCPDRRISRAVLQTLIEYDRFNDEDLMLLVLRQPDTGLRTQAVEHWLGQQLPLSAKLLARLLQDRWPRIRQSTLFCLGDRGMAIPPTLYTRLLMDNRALIRLRTRNMLMPDINVAQCWLSAVVSAEYSPSQRRAALYGLHHIHDPNVLALARWGLSQELRPLQLTAIHILAEVAPHAEIKAPVLAALASPDACGITFLVNLILRYRFPITRDEIHHLLKHAPSVRHTSAYYRLCHNLNKWDSLILLLQFHPTLAEESGYKQLAIWQKNFNLSGIQPDAQQRQQLNELFTRHPEFHATLWSYLPFKRT